MPLRDTEHRQCADLHREGQATASTSSPLSSIPWVGFTAITWVGFTAITWFRVSANRALFLQSHMAKQKCSTSLLSVMMSSIFPGPIWMKSKLLFSLTRNRRWRRSMPAPQHGIRSATQGGRCGGTSIDGQSLRLLATVCELSPEFSEAGYAE